MANWKEDTFSTMQKIGKSLMTPVSVLPAAGLLVALGRIFQGLAKDNPNVLIKAIGDVSYSGGLAIFEQLPAVFAIGVAIGFTGGAGVAGLASIVGYFTLINVLKVMTATLGLKLAINTGVFGGIIVGLMSAFLYKKFHQTKLHSVLGFFSGKRLIPIITAAASIILGILLGFIWPPIQSAINEFGTFVMGSSLGPAFYAAGKRLLIPVGLHHVYYPPFLFQFGEYITEAGKALHGESARYFAGDPKAGLFMASEFPIMLFGLPAACLAMYMRAPKAKRIAVGGILLSAALTSIITGITEPIEFSFIFVAPLLYVLHVVLAFFSGWMTSFFDIHLGYTFSASIIDFIIGFFNQKNSMMLWTVVGPIIFALYFTSFYYLIKFFDFATPGREKESDDDLAKMDLSYDERPFEIIKAFGGKENLKELDACITRLRITVNDHTKVNVAQLKSIGAAGVMTAGNNIQAIFGTESDAIKDQMKSIISGNFKVSTHTTITSEKSPGSVSNSKSSNTSTIIKLSSPLEGEIIDITEVPDPTFADKILGDGIAIKPTKGEVRSPFNGKVLQVFHTKHAIGLKDKNGLEVLIHVGLETVKMNGEGFKSHVENGQTVLTGDLLLTFNLDKIKEKAKSTITPILFTNMNKVENIDILINNDVKMGDEFMNVTVRSEIQK